MKPTTEATARALMALVTDLGELTTSVARVRVQIEALAKRHGVSMPLPLSPSS